MQFVEPFTSLNLAHAAEALNTNVPGVQRELEPLIAQGSIDALIDSHNGVLYAWRREQRAVTFGEAMRVGTSYVTSARVPYFTHLFYARNHDGGHLFLAPQRRHMCGMPRHSCCVGACFVMIRCKRALEVGEVVLGLGRCPLHNKAGGIAKTDVQTVGVCGLSCRF